MSKAGERLIEAATEAIAIARGEAAPARTTHHGVQWKHAGFTVDSANIRIGFDTDQGEVYLIMPAAQAVQLGSAIIGTVIERALPGVLRTIPEP